MSCSPLSSMSDDTIDGSLDEISWGSHDSFTSLKNVVFRQLQEQDHVEQERISWSKLKRWVEFEWFDKLYRDNKINEHYSRDIQEAQIYYKSYTDKVLIKYFQCPFKANKNNELAQAFTTNKTSDDAFVYFDFPYYFPRGLNHYVLFSRYDLINNLGTKQMKRLISNYIEEEFEDILSDKDGNKYEFVYYEERAKKSFFNETENEKQALSEIIDADIIPNIIHVFINITDIYHVSLGANGASWANQSFLWEEACDIIKTKNVHKFGREEKWIRKYIQDRSKRGKQKKNVKKEIGFNSIRDKILIKEFQCKSFENAENGKLKAIVDETTPRLLWTKNLYPYFYEEGIQHNLVWYLDEKVDKDVIEEFIERHIGDKEYNYWENPLHLKSIPDLDHFQVISVNMAQYMENIISSKPNRLSYTNVPYKWSHFAANDDIVNKHESVSEYGCNERVCRQYLEETKQTKIRYQSLFEADLRRYFQCKVGKNAVGKLLAVDVQDVAEKYRFVEDRYHFCLEQGLKQFLFIIQNKEKWTNEKIKEMIQFELGSCAKFVFWIKVNSKDNQQDENNKKVVKKPSNLWYYHVICNETNQSQ